MNSRWDFTDRLCQWMASVNERSCTVIHRNLLYLLTKHVSFLFAKSSPKASGSFTWEGSKIRLSCISGRSDVGGKCYLRFVWSACRGCSHFFRRELTCCLPKCALLAKVASKNTNKIVKIDKTEALRPQAALKKVASSPLWVERGVPKIRKNYCWRHIRAALRTMRLH